MDPRSIPEQNRDLLRFRHWVKTEAQRIADEEGKGSLELHREMVKFWEEHRPQMCRRLGPELTKSLAVVLARKMEEAETANLEAGMYRTDAREQAERDWLLMEPETQET